MRLCRLPAKESHGSASQESPTPLPDGGFISVWHFGLTQSKTRALNSPERHGDSTGMATYTKSVDNPKCINLSLNKRLVWVFSSNQSYCRTGCLNDRRRVQ